MDFNERIDAWLAECPDPATDPLAGMAMAGLLTPMDRYMDIARMKAAIVERTGLLGVASVWGGRQIVGKFFIDGFGTPEQRGAWRGRPLAVAISEPEVGAHPKKLRTKAWPLMQNRFRLTGQKAWVTNGPDAEAIIVIAITAEEEGRKRYSAFIVPRGTKGMTIGDMPGFHALRPSRHCTVLLDGCVMAASAMLGDMHTAYDRMALPFRDQEDAVGTFATLGAFRFLIGRLTGGSDDAALSKGALMALAAVFEAAAKAVVTDLDAGRLRDGSPALVGLRVLAGDMLERAKAHVSAHGPAGDPLVETMLGDLEAVMGVARGPRLMRQARLGR